MLYSKLTFKKTSISLFLVSFLVSATAFSFDIRRSYIIEKKLDYFLSANCNKVSPINSYPARCAKKAIGGVLVCQTFDPLTEAQQNCDNEIKEALGYCKSFNASEQRNIPLCVNYHERRSKFYRTDNLLYPNQQQRNYNIGAVGDNNSFPPNGQNKSSNKEDNNTSKNKNSDLSPQTSKSSDNTKCSIKIDGSCISGEY